MNKHWIESIEIGKTDEVLRESNDKERVEAIVIPESCDWDLVPKIEEMKEMDIEVIVINIDDFAEMFSTIAEDSVIVNVSE